MFLKEDKVKGKYGIIMLGSHLKFQHTCISQTIPLLPFPFHQESYKKAFPQPHNWSLDECPVHGKWIGEPDQ